MAKKIKDIWHNLLQKNGQKNPEIKARTTITLRGAPDDRGVLNVGGRVGAAQGPSHIRNMLSQFMVGMEGALTKICLLPGSDIALDTTIEATHYKFRKQLLEDFNAHFLPIVLGGGHDYGYPHIAAASDYFGVKNTALINVDAHLDMRPLENGLITSGSPFYLALEKGALLPENFIEFGIQNHCNLEDRLQYAKKKKVTIYSLNDLSKARGGIVGSFLATLKKMTQKKRTIIVQFDLDALQMNAAPGVSAPQSDGLTAREFLEIVRICGGTPQVASIGFYELAPTLDSNQMTTRLTATAIHQFVSRCADRSRR